LLQWEVKLEDKLHQFSIYKRIRTTISSNNSKQCSILEQQEDKVLRIFFHKIVVARPQIMIRIYLIQLLLEQLLFNQEQLHLDSKDINSINKTISKMLQFLITKALKNQRLRIMEMEACFQLLLLNLLLTVTIIRCLLSNKL
jgi:hypothetical protein